MAGDIDEFLTRLSRSTHGLADPTLDCEAQELLRFLIRGDAGDGDVAEHLPRVVDELALNVNHQAILNAAINVERSPGSRHARIETLAGRGVELPQERQVTRVVNKGRKLLSAMLEQVRELSDPAAVQHRLVDFEVHIDVGRRGHMARRISETMLVAPRAIEVSRWRGERTVTGKKPPRYLHYGAGRWLTPVDDGDGHIKLEIEFDPPVTTTSRFTVVTEYPERVSKERRSHYGFPAGGLAPERLSVTVQFEVLPPFLYWIESQRRASFKDAPDVCREVDITRGSGERGLVHEVRTGGLANKVSGLIWFWTDPEECGFTFPSSRRRR